MGHTYKNYSLLKKKLFVVYLKVKFNWETCSFLF